MKSDFLVPGDFLPAKVLKSQSSKINIERLSGEPFQIIIIFEKNDVYSEEITKINQSKPKTIIISPIESENASDIPDHIFNDRHYTRRFRFKASTKFLLIEINRNLRINNISEHVSIESLLISHSQIDQTDRLASPPPILIIPQALTNQLCMDLVEKGYSCERQRFIYNSSHKSRQHIVCDDEECRKIDRIFLKSVIPEVEKVFCCEINQREPYKICSYDADSRGFLSDHRDSDPPYTHRRLGMSVTLNDDFQGGELLFPEYRRLTEITPSKSAIVFSGQLMHSVSPVTQGMRWSLVTFLFNKGDHRSEFDYSSCEIKKEIS